jgi:hypothetical protein
MSGEYYFPLIHLLYFSHTPFDSRRLSILAYERKILEAEWGGGSGGFVGLLPQG